MYAVIQTGGKQYKVQPGDVIGIEKLPGEKGSALQFSEVLFCSNPASATDGSSQIWVGAPFIKGAAVSGEILAQGRGEKVLIIKMKRRKQYRRTQGHRQNLTEVLITSVSNGAGQQVALSDADKKTKLSKHFTLLKPKGPASQTKLLGSRVRRAQAAIAAVKSVAQSEEKSPKKKTTRAASTKKTADKAE